MTASYADSHDLDKMARWYGGLSSNEWDGFPAHVMFLVSAGDHAAHDIFRRFRSNFESRAAPFHNLVIFGQHGVSSTVRGMLAQLGLHPGSTPALILFEGASATTVYVLPLAAGIGNDDGQVWEGILAKVEEASDTAKYRLDLSIIPGVTAHPIGERLLLDLVAEVLSGLSTAANPPEA